MELRQLEYFVAVAEEASFTRAARRVHISQSGVSAQIRALERELGAELLDRSRKQVRLTPAGAAVLEHARGALASARAVHESVGEITGLLRGRLTVGMVVGCTVTPLFEALAGFRREHPGVELTLLEGPSERLVEDVRAGAMELALVGLVTVPPDLDAVPLVTDRLVALVPPGHPLAGLPRVTLADLRPYPLVCMPRGTGIRAAFDRACAARRLELAIPLQASAPDAIVELAERGLGVAVLSESMAATYEDRLVARLLADAEAEASLALVFGRAPGPALRELLSFCRSAFGLREDAGAAVSAR